MRILARQFVHVSAAVLMGPRGTLLVQYVATADDGTAWIAATVDGKDVAGWEQLPPLPVVRV